MSPPIRQPRSRQSTTLPVRWIGRHPTIKSRWPEVRVVVLTMALTGQPSSQWLRPSAQGLPPTSELFWMAIPIVLTNRSSLLVMPARQPNRLQNHTETPAAGINCSILHHGLQTVVEFLTPIGSPMYSIIVSGRDCRGEIHSLPLACDWRPVGCKPRDARMPRPASNSSRQTERI